MTSSVMFVGESQKCEMCNLRQARSPPPTPIQLIPRHSMGGLTHQLNLPHFGEISPFVFAIFSIHCLKHLACLQKFEKINQMEVDIYDMHMLHMNNIMITCME